MLLKYFEFSKKKPLDATRRESMEFPFWLKTISDFEAFEHLFLVTVGVAGSKT